MLLRKKQSRKLDIFTTYYKPLLSFHINDNNTFVKNLDVIIWKVPW